MMWVIMVIIRISSFYILFIMVIIAAVIISSLYIIMVIITEVRVRVMIQRFFTWFYIWFSSFYIWFLVIIVTKLKMSSFDIWLVMVIVTLKLNIAQISQMAISIYARNCAKM